jgi:cysteine desulfurase family protein
MIYLDNAATTFPKPEIVYATVNEFQRTYAVNAGRGSYKAAKKASEMISETRAELAELVNFEYENRVVFAPSSTIAMNQVLNGLEFNENIVVYISPFEHNAVVRPLNKLAKRYGFKICFIPFDPDMQEFDYAAMKNMFVLNHPEIVILNHVSNVTGLILPVKQIFEESKKYDAVNILDASQSLGMIPVDLSAISVDFLVFAGHKNLYSNFGVGGFIYNTDIKLNTFITGGTGSDSLNQDMPESIPTKYEAASPDVIAISSLNASLKWIKEIGVSNIYNHKKQLSDYAVKKLSAIDSIDLYVPADTTKHVAVISFTHKIYRPEELSEILDIDFDIAVRCGYHCAPYVHKLLGTVETNGTVRISVGYFSTEKDIDALVSALKELE